MDAAALPAQGTSKQSCAPNKREWMQAEAPRAAAPSAPPTRTCSTPAASRYTAWGTWWRATRDALSAPYAVMPPPRRTCRQRGGCGAGVCVRTVGVRGTEGRRHGREATASVAPPHGASGRASAATGGAYMSCMAGCTGMRRSCIWYPCQQQMPHPRIALAPTATLDCWSGPPTSP